MFRRILSSLHLSWYLPASRAARNSAVAPPATDGQATISFTPGKKTALSAAEAEELQEERRDRATHEDRATDEDLVWPGKTDTIRICNDEPLAYRFELSVTNLDPAYFIQRPPVGGVWQAQGAVLLQPGEEVIFEVVFLPSPQAKAKTQRFHYVLTRFDPHRSNTPGEVLDDMPMRWVSLPTPGDLKLTTSPEEVITRPWRHTALFDLQFQNRSYLPPSVQLQILRGPTKQALSEQADRVSALSQSLEPRTPCVWHCLLPPLRAAYFVTVMGTARVAENIEYTLTLPKPIHVRYIPWLRLGRDWAFLFGALFCLLWLVWGIPVYKAPTVVMEVVFPGKGGAPDLGGQGSDLTVRIMSIDDTTLTLPQEGQFTNTNFVFKLPGRWYGYRWPFPWWNGWVHAPKHFQANIYGPEGDKAAPYTDYDFGKLQPAVGAGDLFSFEKRTFFGDWVTPCKAFVHRKKSIRVNFYIDALGVAKYRDGPIKVSYRIGDNLEKKEKIYQLPPDVVKPLREKKNVDLIKPLLLNKDSVNKDPVNLEAAPGLTREVEFWAVVGDVESGHKNYHLEPRDDGKSTDIHLRFPAFGLLPSPTDSPVAGKPFTLPIEGSAEGARVFVNNAAVPTYVMPTGIRFVTPNTPGAQIQVTVQSRDGSQTVPRPFTVQPDYETRADNEMSKGLDDSAFADAQKLPENSPMRHAIRSIFYVHKSEWDKARAEAEEALRLTQGRPEHATDLARNALEQIKKQQPPPVSPKTP